MRKFSNKSSELKICVIGLGYVGLPLAIEFGKKINTIGFDLNKSRISQLIKKYDKNNEIIKDNFIKSKKLTFTCKINDIKDSNFFIVCVPTPVNKKKIPDLNQLMGACNIVSKVISKNDYVIFESTVYPGTTEDVCIPLINKQLKKRGLVNNINNYYNYGYSPERVNPGDTKNNISRICKIVSGNNTKSLNYIHKVYSIVMKKIYKSKNIKIAESAKIIENCQRDINIAFMNELAIVFGKLKVDFKEVLKAASTKWNFINFKPGLVGGHCIGVDPYYLAYKSKMEGYKPEIILSGRKINDQMSAYYAKKISHFADKNLKKEKIKVLTLGVSFKENVKDIRNSKAFDVIEKLGHKYQVHIFDPVIEKNQLNDKYKKNYISKPKINYYDIVVLLVSHDVFLKKKFYNKLNKFTKNKSLIFDIKHNLNSKLLGKKIIRL